MKVVFMGTPDFAVPSLEMLIEKHEVVAVVTQPDKPKGRGKKMVYPIIKEKALEHNIKVLQPNKVREEEFLEVLKELNADIIVVVAYGQILPESILNMPKYGCINVHGSLLPKYRGAAPIQWSVINGEKKTGVTTMYMAKGLDSGDMLLIGEMDILEDDTFGSLRDRMSLVGAKVLEETLEKIQSGSVERIEQNHNEATYAPMIEKETGHINWEKGSDEIINLIKGMDPQPGAFCIYKDEVLKVWKAVKAEDKYESAKIGEIVDINKKGFIVKTNDGALLITEIQAKGGKRMTTDAYMRGHEIEKGSVLI